VTTVTVCSMQNASTPTMVPMSAVITHLAAGSVRTSTHTEIGRAGMTHLQGKRSYRRAE
jgi:hypothetical protein